MGKKNINKGSEESAPAPISKGAKPAAEESSAKGKGSAKKGSKK